MLSVRKGAEMVAMGVTINKKKFVFCAVYRVNNLGEDNYTSIMNTIKIFYKNRNPRKIFVIGDVNLSGVSWPQSDNSVMNIRVEKLFG